MASLIFTLVFTVLGSIDVIQQIAVLEYDILTAYVDHAVSVCVCVCVL